MNIINLNDNMFEFKSNFSFMLENTYELLDTNIKVSKSFSKILNNTSIFLYGEYEVITLIMEKSNGYTDYKTKNFKVSFINSFKYEKLSFINDLYINSIKITCEFLDTPNIDIIIDFDKYNKKIIKGTIYYKIKFKFNSKDNLNYLSNKKSTNFSNIEALVVVGFGNENILFSDYIDLFENSPPIFKIISSYNEVKIETSSCKGEIAYVNGYVDLSFQYISLENYTNNSSSGAIYFFNKKLPFSSLINLKAEKGKKLLKTDICSLIKVSSDKEIINLEDPIKVSENLFVYKKIYLKLPININLTIVRNENINITTY